MSDVRRAPRVERPVDAGYTWRATRTRSRVVGGVMGLVASAESSGNGRTRAGVVVSYAPATGEVLGEVPIRSAAEVRDAVERARRAQQAWAALSFEERRGQLLRWRDALVERAEALVDLLVRECGKPRVEALVHEVLASVNHLDWVATRAARILAPREIEMALLKHRRAYVHYAPRGVVGVITPWNFPMFMPMRDVGSALAAGNAAVLKPSEVTPLIALELKSVYDEAGLPPDLFQVVTGDGSTGAALIDAKPDMIVFTGAVATGRRVAAACGERLIPCTMELGGKAPAIVCADADVERAARAIVTGGFANCGQVCVSVERVFAHEAVHDRLLERLRALTAALRQGDPASPDTDVGAIIFPRQIAVAEELVADAIAHGARLETGGKRRPGPGQFYEPTLLSGCQPDMRVMREEIFGPVVPVMKVRDEEEAVRLANDSELGLMAYVFTKDRERGRRLAERVRAGVVMVNDVLSDAAVPETPFGGVRNSGFGRVGGEEGLREMCEVRVVSYDRIALGVREPTWFPYGEKTYRLARGALRLLFRRRSPVRRLLELF
ncbi:MAG: aldehyde dehydrogenase family protein [Myxococcales bacterium]|nr:aldehyde dehydrogenase family protein [Myxococcales bacterium]